MAEQVLEPALHPSAFDGPARPKGPVWYLSSDVGRAKWRNPFHGIVVPKAPVRKPGAPRPKPIKPKKEDVRKKKEATPAATAQRQGSAGPALPRIKLRIAASNAAAESSPAPDDSSDIPSSSRASSVAPSASTVPTTPSGSTPSRQHRRRKPRASVFDSSESESSDDDEDAQAEQQPQLQDPAAARRIPRRMVLPPMALGAGARFHPPSRNAHSPLGELFFSPISSQQALPAAANASPFPSHCLDNTTWVARRSAEDEAFTALETSSSSEDEEMRNADWGAGLGFMVKADEEDLTASWMSESDAKLSEATDAMSQLFPYKDGAGGQGLVFNQLDNRPAPSDASSLAESSTTATANAVYQGKLRTASCPNALPAWAMSSPVSSPSMAGRALPMLETSPTQSLSRPARDFESRQIDMSMDVDMAEGDESWLDESGQLPVHAEDSFSDAEVGSALGETTPERDRQLQTAEWARETAQSAMEIKHEPEDYYPSPAATSSPGDDSGGLSAESRESTVSTASSPLSELPELDSDTNDTVEILLGPESIDVNELDDWLPQGKESRTPHRGRGRHARQCDSTRSSGSWGGIGVNNPFIPASTSTCKAPPLLRKRSSLRATPRRNRSNPRKTERLTPAPSPPGIVVVDIAPDSPPPVEDIEVEEGGIGTAELELAYAEAQAREEQVRAQKHAEAEESKRRWDACRRAFADAAAAETPSNVSPTETPAPSSSCSEAQPTWSEMSGTWGSSESLADLGAPLPTTLSPLALQMTGISSADSAAILHSLDPKALHSSPSQDAMMLDSVLVMAEIDAMAAQLLPPAVTPAPTATPSLPAIAPAPPAAAPKKLAPKRAQPIAPAPVPIAPAPVPVEKATKPTIETVEKALAPKPPAKSASLPSTPTLSAMAPPPVSIAPAPPHARPQTKIPVPLAAAPVRTKSPVARVATTSPTGSSTPSDASGPSTSSLSSAPTGQSTPSSVRSATPSSGGTTKRLLPGIDACVVDNLPCYSHVWDNPNGGRCTVLRRLDTDFVNGTALLTALGVPPACHAEHLNAPVPTLASHRTVPLVSPQGLHHAPGVPGVWIPLVEARDLAQKLHLKGSTLLANLLREDLFQLFKELAGLSLRHTSSTESFGMPFVTQPHQRKPLPPRPSSATPSTGSSATSSQARPVAKPPLVRPPTAQPEGCPQPKRRRATVVAATATREQAIQAVRPQLQGKLATPIAPAPPRKPIAPIKPLQPAPAAAPGPPAPAAPPPVTRAKAAPIAPRRSARASIGAK